MKTLFALALLSVTIRADDGLQLVASNATVPGAAPPAADVAQQNVTTSNSNSTSAWTAAKVVGGIALGGLALAGAVALGKHLTKSDDDDNDNYASGSRDINDRAFTREKDEDVAENNRGKDKDFPSTLPPLKDSAPNFYEEDDEYVDEEELYPPQQQRRSQQQQDDIDFDGFESEVYGGEYDGEYDYDENNFEEEEDQVLFDHEEAGEYERPAFNPYSAKFIRNRPLY